MTARRVVVSLSLAPPLSRRKITNPLASLCVYPRFTSRLRDYRRRDIDGDEKKEAGSSSLFRRSDLISGWWTRTTGRVLIIDTRPATAILLSRVVLFRYYGPEPALPTAPSNFHNEPRAPMEGSIFLFPRQSEREPAALITVHTWARFRRALVKVQFVPIFGKQIEDGSRTASFRGIKLQEHQKDESSWCGKLVATLPSPPPLSFSPYI